MNNILFQPLVRFVTRPSSSEEDCDVDLILGTAFKNSSNYIKPNHVYEIVYNKFSGVVEVKDMGETWIQNKWVYEYHTLPQDLGNTMWLTKEEYREYLGSLEKE